VALNPALSSWKVSILHVPTRNVRDFLKFSVCFSKKHYPSLRCVYAANAVGKDLDIFALGMASLSYTL
jgi:hypothetical protein